MTLTDRIVAHAVETPAGAIDDAARVAAANFVLDTLGVGVAGAGARYADEIFAAASRWGVASDGTGAHVLGRGVALPAPSAAFVNGFQIHCQEFDCVHEPAVVHPLATILAALLAEAEATKRWDGPAFLDAVVLAVDVAAGLGMASRSPIRFFRPATAGVMGATLGVARLRGLGNGKARDALGHALAHCAGTMQAHVEGTPALPLQIGNAARAALLACDVAEAGLPGVRDAIDGPFGYLPLFEGDFDAGRILPGPDDPARILQVSHKPFPTGRAAQGGIVAAQALRAQGVAPDDLDALELEAPPLIVRLVGRPYRADMAVSYARLCFPFLAALTLEAGSVVLGDFSETRMQDPRIGALAARVRVRPNAVSDPAAFTPQRLTAHLRSGRMVCVDVDRLYGSPADPLGRDARLEKVGACIVFGLGKAAGDVANRLVAAVEAMPAGGSLEPAARLAAGLDGGAGRGGRYA